MRIPTLLTAVVGVVVIAGCQFPRDPEETLDRVEGGTMFVGVMEDEPWVVLEPGREPQGVEPLVRELTASTGASGT